MLQSADSKVDGQDGQLAHLVIPGQLAHWNARGCLGRRAQEHQDIGSALFVLPWLLSGGRARVPEGINAEIMRFFTACFTKMKTECLSIHHIVCVFEEACMV